MKKTAYLTVIFIMLATSIMASENVPQWELFEKAFTASTSANPFTTVQFSAEFRFRNRILVTEGFYDGQGIYKIRFMPDTEGEWTYETKSNVREMNGKTGKFFCIAPLTGAHGPVSVRNTFDFGYADGTPFYPVGTTCYAWVWQGDEMVNKTLKTLSESAFNKIRMGIFPKQYDKYIQNEPELYPFEGSKQEGWDYTRFNPAYFQYFEDKIGKLMKLGIEADVILFHPYDWGKWGFDAMPPEVNERYLHYVIARFAAYRNVWWSMANEWDVIASKKEQDWERLFRIVQDYDPYRHLLSIHNGMVWYDVSKPYISHLSVQTTDFFHLQDWRDLYRKPVIIDECVYEGDVPNDWGNLTAEEMTSRFWQVYCRGGYCTHGETYMNPENILWWSKGGTLYGKSPERIGFLRKIMEQRPVDGVVPFHNLWNKEMYLMKDREYYLFYYGNSQQKLCRLSLPADLKFKVEVIDTWEMTISPVDGTYSGDVEIDLPGKPWMAVRATAVAPDPDLVAWWSFDDATLSSAPDQSVHSLNAVNKGAVPVEGKYGRALQFDGNSVLQVDYQPILDDFQKGITVMAWIKKDTASHWNTIVSREIGSGWSEYMGLAIYKNQALFSIDQDGTKYINITDAGIIQPDVWYHLAGTFDNNTLKIYVNGKLIKSAFSKGRITFSDKNPLLIGGNSNNQNQSLVDCFKGTIDEVRIYKRAFTLDEINKLIN